MIRESEYAKFNKMEFSQGYNSLVIRQQSQNIYGSRVRPQPEVFETIEIKDV